MRQTAPTQGAIPRDRAHHRQRAGIFGDDPVGAAQEIAELGVSRVIVPAFLLRKPSERDAMEAFAERVIKPTASIG